MADNVSITAGTGTTIAADEVTRNATSEKQQLIKIAIGTDGNYEGMVATTFPLPVGGTDALALGKAEDAAHASGHTGAFVLAIRRDTAAALTDTTGDYTGMAANSFGALQINVDSDFQASTAKGILKAEDGVHTSGDAGVMILGVRADADASGTGTDGDYGFLALDSLNRLKIAAGSGATSLGKLEDNPHSSGDLGVMVLGVRTDTAGTGAGTTGDYSFMAVGQSGSVKVDVDRTFQRSAADCLLKAEDAVHASGDAGVMVLGVSNETATNFAADGDYVPISVNRTGSVNVRITSGYTSGPADILKVEDNAFVNGDALVAVAMVRSDTVPANAGTSASGDYAPLFCGSTGGLYVTEVPDIENGYDVYRNVDLDETGIGIKGTKGKVYGYHIHNSSAQKVWVKLYNTAGAPTVGTTTPYLTLGIPTGDTVAVEFSKGIPFSSGIGIGATTGAADNSTGAPGTGDIQANIFYK